MSEFGELIKEFNDSGTQICGINVDVPFEQNQFANEFGTEFLLLIQFNEAS